MKEVERETWEKDRSLGRKRPAATKAPKSQTAREPKTSQNVLFGSGPLLVLSLSCSLKPRPDAAPRKLCALSRNDFAEASERHLEGTKPNEPIPKLSELRKKKGKGAPGLGGGGPNLGMGGAGPGNAPNARIGGGDDMDMAAATTDGGT